MILFKSLGRKLASVFRVVCALSVRVSVTVHGRMGGKMTRVGRLV